MTEEKAVIAMVEDQRSIGRPWLRGFRRRDLGEAPDENLFTTVPEALAWVLASRKRRWLLLVDIDLEDDTLEDDAHPQEAERLRQARELLQQEEPGLARYTGAVLLRCLLELEEDGELDDVRSHVLVVTAQALTVLARWFGDGGFRFLAKPVLMEELADEVSGRLAALASAEVNRGA